MHKINITTISYTKKYPAVFQVDVVKLILLAEIAKIYSDYTNSWGLPLDVVNIYLV